MTSFILHACIDVLNVILPKFKLCLRYYSRVILHGCLHHLGSLGILSMLYEITINMKYTGI